jgi:hypothetical protein
MPYNRSSRLRIGATLAIAAAFGTLVATAPTLAADNAGDVTIVDAEKLEWKDYPGLPGVKFVVLAGNPKEPGLYVIRARFAPHTMSRPQWYPEARYVVVLKGTWWAGEGDKLDPTATTPVPAGGFAVHPPRLVHYDGAKDEEVIVQITGIGPSGTHVVEAAK